MSIERLDFDNIDERDVEELVSLQVPEGLRIDYKRDIYGNSDADKKEILKDVSGFSNAFGGHLVIGVEEQNGVPVAIPGIPDTNPDDVILRLGNIIRDRTEPRIQGIRFRAVPFANGSHCFLLRIPRSWNPPHGVRTRKSIEFWIRNSGGKHEASVEELRTLFTLGADAFHRVHQFRDERLREIRSELVGGRKSVPKRRSVGSPYRPVGFRDVYLASGSRQSSTGPAANQPAVSSHGERGVYASLQLRRIRGRTQRRS
ncbi:MAG: hypothetical protein CO109_07690 [Deltaproteobacteria bacterium CG_4_9_14_3_um_filter_65_9]|nr:MAG: hypothetical protein CO109_07690 [Deltaproteobacteria bacterium CG_4_9_14_3_um_filter_65_9]